MDAVGATGVEIARALGVLRPPSPACSPDVDAPGPEAPAFPDADAGEDKGADSEMWAPVSHTETTPAPQAVRIEDAEVTSRYAGERRCFTA
jgi:hypothetical protein